jgi:hypothetical protein
MGMRRAQQFVYGQTGWMLATILGLSLLGELSIETFFIGSLFGFLVLTELTAPFDVSPTWRARLKWFVLLGMVAFGYFMVRRVLDFLPEGFL